MHARTVPRTLILLFSLALLSFPAGCSKDDNPTVPDDNTNHGNTPPLPTVTSPTDELPSKSEVLVTDDALLANFSPKMTDQCSILDTLNDNAIALAFEMAPGYGQLVLNGQPCPPDNLKWSTFGLANWSDCVLATAGPCFEYLGEREGSYYYGLTAKGMWMALELNCRLAGGNLATINSAAENSFVQGLRQAWRPGEYLAIGLYDWGRTNNDFAWSSGEPLTYTNWNGGEPNNDGGEYFGHLASTNAGWNDYRGVTPMNGVMEIDHQLADQGSDPVPVLLLGESPLYLDDLGWIEGLPHIVREVYWAKVFQKTLGAGASYSQEHSYTKGTSETTGMSFGWSVGISTKLGWGPVSAQIETEFHQDFNREVSVYGESTVTKTYECTAPAGKTVIFAVWQLRERFTICNADGETWSDPKYHLDGELPHMDQGLDQEYLQTLYFDQ